MHFSSTLLSALLTTTPALASVLLLRAQSLSTSTNIITKTTVKTVAFTVNSNIETTGVQTLIPGALTLTFNYVPAYIYIETSSVTTKTVLSTSKVVITLFATTTATPAAMTVKPTTTKSTSTSKTSTTVASSSSSASNTLAAYTSCFLQGSPASGGDLVVFGTYTTSTPEECLNYCSSTTACETYSYSPSTNECTNYSGAFAEDYEITSGNTGVFFGSKNNNDGRMTCYENAVKAAAGIAS